MHDFFPSHFWDVLSTHQGPTTLLTFACGHLYSKKLGLRSVGDLLHTWSIEAE